MKIAILTGAGISAESGIQTFRDQNGLWENHRIEDVATPEAFTANPELVQNFYNLRRRQLLSTQVKENPAHYALAKLEHEHTGDVQLITQNIDDLHERAGSQNIHHMHGELLKMRCIHTQQVYDITADIIATTSCECCNKTQSLRPHIVWFGEIPFAMDTIFSHLKKCELFISIGTSAVVYPAAMFIQFVKGHTEARCIEVNLQETPMSPWFDEKRAGMASIEVPKLVKEILQT